MNSYDSKWIVADGAPEGFCSAPVAVVVEDLDEAQPKTIQKNDEANRA